MKVTIDNLGELAFDSSGLIPAVAQNRSTGEVLMVAWMTHEAVRETLARRRAVFWSRSRARLWEKGEESGNALDLIEIHADCDRDTLLLLVTPRGPACHVGTLTCFNDGPLASGRLSFLGDLEDIIGERIRHPDPQSYTAKLIDAGMSRMAQKVGEEGVEVALAASSADRAKIVAESADLLFHLTVLLNAAGLSLTDVAAELRKRHLARR
jgi:phosphoribosyl-ATP pyrophosphohydrolase/phosphoribosyl-AMP cyclohydrolase